MKMYENRSFNPYKICIDAITQLTRNTLVNFAAKDFETLKRSLGCKKLPETVIFSAAKDGLQSKEDPFAQKLNIPIPIEWEGKGPF